MTEPMTTEQVAQGAAGTHPQGPPPEPAVETPSDTENAVEATTSPAPATQPGGGAPPDTEMQRPSSDAAGDNAGGRDRPEGAGAEGLLRDSGAFVERWNGIQVTFVDEPRQAVERADTLVAEVIQELARVFAEERQRLETAWSGGESVSTEDLRQALQRYRAFFQTLLRS